ncbi:MAG: hypothetical protein KAS86_04100 [Candidatus Omnitrophica bacterium]|nr:hypothetical protein [Candidatus Omnitrophota bacterium]
MKKNPVFLIVAVLAIVLVLSVAKNTIARISVERGVRLVTGLSLKMKSLDIGIIRTLIDINDLRLFNPPGYEDRVMLDMPEIFVDYDLPAIIRGRIHLEKVRINLKEFVVVKNDKGELNLDSLKSVQQQKKAEKPAARKKGKAPEIQIDVLELKIGKVIYKDYSAGGKPAVKEFDINIDEKFRNIDDPNKLISLIVVKALMHTTIAELADFDLSSLEGPITDTLAAAQKIVGGAGGVLAGTTEQARETVKATAGLLKETTEDLKEVIKFPFGSKEE